MKTALLTLVGLVVLALLAGLLFIYSGAFPVAASDADSALKEWVFRTTLHQAVSARADEIETPKDLDSDERVLKGIANYESMCVVCHGAPGKKPASFATQMNPEPPELARAAGDWSSAELFWITKHGIEMTAMPAWGTTHSDEQLWDLVAAVNRLPQVSADEYDALVEQARRQGLDHHAPGSAQPHDHGHGGSGHHDDRGQDGAEEQPDGHGGNARDARRPPDGGHDEPSGSPDAGSRTGQAKPAPHDHDGHDHKH